MAAVKVAQGDVAPGSGTVVEASGRQIALFNVAGTFYAIDNTCLHSGGPLGEGSLEGPVVTCPWHGWEYNVTSGQCQMDASINVATYPVRVEGNDVVIEVP